MSKWPAGAWAASIIYALVIWTVAAWVHDSIRKARESRRIKRMWRGRGKKRGA